MERKRVNAILSDYDGTLCPTIAVRGDVRNDTGKIPHGLEQILNRLSELIPLCIVSSKDFVFLHNRAKFAKIFSCVLGIETVIHNFHNADNNISNNDCIHTRHLITNYQSLMDNSRLLHKIMKIAQNHKEIMVEEKYTSDNEILIGLTFDYRHLENWRLFKENTEPNIREIIQRSISTDQGSNLSSKDRPFIQTYSSHPFLDVYGANCDKGLAIDNILSYLEEKDRRETNIMYLGDSENDNPAFRKSDISIGIRSDKRLDPNLDCKYMLDFYQLPLFLQSLTDNKLVFSEELLAK